MSSSAALRATSDESIDAVALGRTATDLLEKLLAQATSAVRARVSEGGKLSARLLEEEQRAAHGLAWLATYVFGVRELVHYADRLSEDGRFGETEALLVQIGAWRICRPDPRRHPYEPGGDGPSGGSLCPRRRYGIADAA